ncbi:MAG: histidine phosphatase family protein [Anaerolineales bacterium]
MSHELWLLRHGQSLGNRDHVRQGQRDYPLTDLGISQIQITADHWKDQDLSFDLIVSSPLQRALSSAEIIADALQGEVETDDLWMERHSGEAEGRSLDSTDLPGGAHRHAPAHQPAFQGGESRLDLHLRAAAGLRSILTRPPGRYLVVAHGGILNALIHVVLGLAPSGRSLLPRFAHHNGGYSLLGYDTELGQWTFWYLNQVGHLEQLT